MSKKPMPDILLRLLSLASRAPSTHNSQPWIFKLLANECRIYIDPSKKLPAGDPLDRYLYISLGCLLENIVLIAEYWGILDHYELMVSDDLVAVVTFKNLDQPPSPRTELKALVSAIEKRKNVRGVFRSASANRQLINALRSLSDNERVGLEVTVDKAKLAAIANLTAIGIKQSHKNPALRREVKQWIKSNFSKDPEGLHGQALRMSPVASLIIPLVLPYVNLGSPLAKAANRSVSSASGAVIFSSLQQGPKDWVEVGRLAQRTMLYLVSQNWQCSIQVAAIESNDTRRALQEAVGSQHEPQFMLVFGKMDGFTYLTPRHPISTKTYPAIKT